MAKILLVDADGVALKKHAYFSETYSKQHNVPIETMIPFFKNEFKQCQIGKLDAKTALRPYLVQWNWDKSADEFMQYWCETDTIPDETVIDALQSARRRGHKCYLTTDQEQYRGQYINNTLGFSRYFDGTFYSYDLGYSKSDQEFFQKVISMLEATPQEIIYWDDDQKNIEVAKSCGIDARLYQSFEEFSKELKVL